MTHPTPSIAPEPTADVTAADGAGPLTGAHHGSTDLSRETTSAPPQPGWLETVQSIWQDLPGLVSDRVGLLSLELQRAGRALAQIVALLVAAIILGITAWLALWAGVAVGLVELGLHWSLSLLLVLAANAGVAWLAMARLRLLLPLLRLPATLRNLTPGRSNESTGPVTPPLPVSTH